MKVTAEASAIKKGLGLIRCGNPGGFHAERGVRIQARGKGVLEFTTTDLEHWETLRVVGQEVKGEGTALVPWSEFRKVVGILKDETVTLEDSKDYLTIRCGETTMKMATLQPVREEHPVFPSPPPRPKDATAIKLHLGALAEVSKFSSGDETRPVLGCVQYDRGTYVCTDSYRLSLVEMPENATDINFLIPRSIHRAMTRMGAPKWVDCWVSDPHSKDATIWADLGDASVVGRLSTSGFPNYETLVSGAISSKGATLKATEEFRDAALRIYRLTRAMGGANKWDLASPVQITTKGNKVVMTVQVEDNIIEIKAAGSISTSVAFNPKYLAEFFEGTNVDSMFGADSLKPWGLTEDADYCAGARRTRLLMPTRVYDDRARR